MYARCDDKSGLYGYWAGGSWAIEPRFAYAHGFVGGYAAVTTVEGHPSLIAADGTTRNLQEICGGRVPISDELSYFTGFGDWHSRPSRYAVIRTANRGRREWGLIDTSLNYKPLAGPAFAAAAHVQIYGEYAFPFRQKGSAHNSTCGLFNLDEMRLEIPVKYSCIYPSDGPIWVVAQPAEGNMGEDRFSFYDLGRREFMPGQFCGALPFSCGLGAIDAGEPSGRSYYVDESLNQVFGDARRFSHGLAAVFDGEDAGYIDTTGRMRLLLPYEDLQPFNEFGLAIANRDDREWDLDIIDRTGRARLGGLGIAVFWEGDFPHFEVEQDGERRIFDVDLNLVY